MICTACGQEQAPGVSCEASSYAVFDAARTAVEDCEHCLVQAGQLHHLRCPVITPPAMEARLAHE